MPTQSPVDKIKLIEAMQSMGATPDQIAVAMGQLNDEGEPPVDLKGVIQHEVEVITGKSPAESKE